MLSLSSRDQNEKNFDKNGSKRTGQYLQVLLKNQPYNAISKDQQLPLNGLLDRLYYKSYATNA